MGILKSANLTTTNYTDEKTEFTVDSKSLNSPSSLDETSYTPSFDKWNGYYRDIPQARQIIDTISKWVFGKGFKGRDKAKLSRIIGNGKENARKVFINIWKTAKICGDGFGEVIKDKSGRITNLKPLNPQRMKVIYSNKGIIKEYRQDRGDGTDLSFSKEEILHMQNGRIGDEMGGMSIFEALEALILSENEVMSDLRTLFHRFVKPIKFFYSDTDDEAVMAAQAKKINDAYAKTENIVLPKGTLEESKTEIVSTQTGGLSPLEYYKLLIRTFTSACGVPEVIMGWSSDTTEASAKIVYLAWEQTIEDEQLSVEEDLENQLNIKINLEFPQTIEEQLAKDKSKDGSFRGEKKSEISPSSPTIKND